MGKIKLKNIRLYAYHGCMDEEGKIGSEYRVDVNVDTNFTKPAKTDLLKDTVDYVSLNRIVKEEMGVRTKLLETVADKILTRILKEHRAVKKAVVKVAKLNPPIGGNVAKVVVEMRRERQ